MKIKVNSKVIPIMVYELMGFCFQDRILQGRSREDSSNSPVPQGVSETQSTSSETQQGETESLETPQGETEFVVSYFYEIFLKMLNHVILE